MKIFLPFCLISYTSSFTLPEFLMGPSYELERVLEDKGSPGTIAPTALEQSLTESPTESPAPSPSPSEIPTIEPTVTAKPTGEPTSQPTESPAPSPSPSEIPTDMPSDVPSQGPTIQPTVSSAPSGIPSATPTASPTSSPSNPPTHAPTVSAAPSAAPSNTPSRGPTATPSLSPSSSPTHVESFAVESFSLLMPRIDGLDEPQMISIESTAAMLLEQPSQLESGTLQDVSVRLVTFEPIELPRDTNGTVISVLDLKQALNLTLDITGDYYGTARILDFEELIRSIFVDDADAWYDMLAAEDSVFSVLLPTDDTSGALLQLDQENSAANDPLIRYGRRISNGGIAAVTLLALAALTLGLAASAFAVRSYRKATLGVELTSPQSNESGSQERSQRSRGSRSSKQAYAPEDEQVADEQEPEFDVDEQESVDLNNVTTKKSYSYDHADSDAGLATDHNPLTFDQLLSRANKPHQPPYLTAQARNDPPIHRPNQHKLGGNSMKSLLDNSVSVGVTLHSNVSYMSIHRKSQSEVSAMTRQLSRTSALSRNDYMEMTLGGGQNGADLQKPRSNNGTKSTGSDFSNQARNFFQGLVSSNAHDVSMKNLGARAVEPDEEMHLQEKHSYDNSLSRRSGLYDVFAPAGPIGIVVDTTKYGPAVHSLKRTSPMLGLINPGDLIVGLDDEDTRGMTAATLTRLMARKSNQKERKITLLTTDNN